MVKFDTMQDKKFSTCNMAHEEFVSMENISKQLRDCKENISDIAVITRIVYQKSAGVFR